MADRGPESAAADDSSALSLVDFDFHLPEQSIAQRPLPRGESRLLFLPRAGALQHQRFSDLPDLMRAGDRLVVNDTQVLACRLRGRKRAGDGADDGAPGGRVEALLTEPVDSRRWWSLIKPGRRTRPGVRLSFEPKDGASPDGCASLEARVEERKDGRFLLEFEHDPVAHLDRFGRIPLPPYIRRVDDEQDRTDYQTLFARSPGAIAAPTAGLHFTPALLERLAQKEIAVSRITLHVGPATFLPVQVEDLSHRRLGAERFQISESTAEEIRGTRAAGGRIVAVGTTSVRALESAARGDGTVGPICGATELMIIPGHAFRVVDALITNFHLPCSTLLMLVCSLAGRDRVLDAYKVAVSSGYRFYSYGDAMFVERS